MGIWDAIGTKRAMWELPPKNSLLRILKIGWYISPMMLCRNIQKPMESMSQEINCLSLIFINTWKIPTQNLIFFKTPTRKWSYFFVYIVTSNWCDSVNLLSYRCETQIILIWDLRPWFHDRWKLQNMAHRGQHKPMPLTVMSFIGTNNPIDGWKCFQSCRRSTLPSSKRFPQTQRSFRIAVLRQ